MAWTTAIATKIGTAHMGEGVPCQDAVGLTTLPGGQVIGVLSDGMGSCPLSHVGARLTVTTFLAVLSHTLADAQDPEQSIAAQFAEALAEARMAIVEQAISDNKEVAEYCCTVVAFVVCDDWSAFASVGDGFVAVRARGATSYEVVLPPEKGERANESPSVLDDQAETRLRVLVSHRAVGCVVASSDGLLYLALTSREWKPHQPFFEFVEREVLADGGDARAEEFLRLTDLEERSDDDLSLVCCRWSQADAPSTDSKSPALDVMA
jgi:hypothetical protein